MNFYEQLMHETQMRLARGRNPFDRGGAPLRLTQKDQGSHDEQIRKLAKMVEEADCILVGAASGLSAAGGGDFYYGGTPSFYEHFGKFARKYHFEGAFNGMMVRWKSDEERWAYVATFLNTTLGAPLREPYRDLAAILEGRDFFVLTTNQDTQFVKLYPEDKVAQIQGDHRFFQCAQCCTDHVWDSTEHVARMIEAMGEGTSIPTELIPRCPNCGGEAFPWVRGYGNYLEGERYHGEYQKVSDYLTSRVGKKILFFEMGVGRMTPMFIQEPFWMLTASLPEATYATLNDVHAFLPQVIEDRGVAVKADIAQTLKDLRAELGR